MLLGFLAYRERANQFTVAPLLSQRAGVGDGIGDGVGAQRKAPDRVDRPAGGANGGEPGSTNQELPFRAHRGEPAVDVERRASA